MEGFYRKVEARKLLAQENIVPGKVSFPLWEKQGSYHEDYFTYPWRMERASVAHSLMNSKFLTDSLRPDFWGRLKLQFN